MRVINFSQNNNELTANMDSVQFGNGKVKNENFGGRMSKLKVEERHAPGDFVPSDHSGTR